MKKYKFSCCNTSDNKDAIIGEYVCYCNHVTENNIKDSILKGAKTVQDVIKDTGAIENSNCTVNNPKGSCCYSDIVYVFNKYKKY